MYRQLITRLKQSSPQSAWGPSVVTRLVWGRSHLQEQIGHHYLWQHSWGQPYHHFFGLQSPVRELFPGQQGMQFADSLGCVDVSHKRCCKQKLPYICNIWHDAQTANYLPIPSARVTLLGWWNNTGCIVFERSCQHRVVDNRRIQTCCVIVSSLTDCMGRWAALQAEHGHLLILELISFPNIDLFIHFVCSTVGKLWVWGTSILLNSELVN